MTNIKNKKKIKKKEKVLSSIIVFLLIIIITIFIALLNKNNKVIYKDDFIDEKYKFLTETKSYLLDSSNIFDNTEEIIDKILKNYNSKTYNLNKPYVLLNPFGNAPLSALILFNTSSEESVEVTIKGKNNDDIVYKFKESKEHFIPIYNLYNNYENEIILKTSSGKSKTINIFTNFSLDFNNSVIKNEVDDSFYYYTLFDNMIVSFDKYGEPRNVLKNINTDNFIIDKDNIIFCDISNNEIFQMDLLGRVNKIYEVDKHYSNFIKYNDNILLIDNNNITELDTKVGKFVKNINLNEILNIKEKIKIDYITTDNNNLIFYIENTNSIVSLNYSNNIINYIIGNKYNWNLNMRKYVLEKKGNYIGPSKTNAISVLDNNILTLNDKINNNFIIYNVDNNNYSVSVIERLENKEFKSSAKNYISYDGKYNIIVNKEDLKEGSYTDIYQYNNKEIIYNLKINKKLDKVVKYKVVNNKHYDFSNGKYFYYKNEVPYIEIKDDELLNFKNAEIKNINMLIINNQLYVQNYDNIQLSLVSTLGIGYKYTLENTNKINLNLLNKGKYYIYYYEDGNLYNSKRYIIVE